MTRYDHRLFTLIYRWFARAAELGPLARIRAEALAGASGTLLIVGLGPGYDLDHLPPAVRRVIAIEPSEPMRQAARGAVERARARGVIVDLVAATGEALPVADDSVDSALLAFVLCSVDDVSGVASEVSRVVRPGGTVGLAEHVRAPAGSPLMLVQQLVKPWWPVVTGGCHADRDPRSLLEAMDLDTTEVRDCTLPTLLPVAPTIVGTLTTHPR